MELPTVEFMRSHYPASGAVLDLWIAFQTNYPPTRNCRRVTTLDSVEVEAFQTVIRRFIDYNMGPAAVSHQASFDSVRWLARMLLESRTLFWLDSDKRIRNHILSFESQAARGSTRAFFVPALQAIKAHLRETVLREYPLLGLQRESYHFWQRPTVCPYVEELALAKTTALARWEVVGDPRTYFAQLPGDVREYLLLPLIVA